MTLGKDRLRDVLFWTTAALLFFSFTAMCLRAIGNAWLWGHDGYAGAAFWQAARNSLRFDVVGQAQEYMELAPPPPGSFYTHHPMLLHAHLVLAQSVLGEAEWAARLVPALYSIVTLPLLYAVTATLWNRATGLVAAFLYAVTPLNLIFANMVNHKQGSIVYLLCLTYCYVRWHERGGWGWFAGIAASFSLAAQFDWPAYYIAAFMGAHALATTALRSRQEGRGILGGWRHEYTFGLALSAVALVNFGGFFAWIIATRGDLADMAAAFSLRTSRVDGYWSGIWARSLDLYGLLPLGLLSLWLVSWTRRRPRGRDVIPWFFLGAQLVHSLVFRQAGHLHSYWTWHANPAIAIAGAEVVVFMARQAWRAWPPLTAPLALAVFVALGIWQALFAWRQVQWGFATGSASYAYSEADDDYFHEIAWARELGRHFSRARTRYLIHDSVRRRRIEFMFYLDAPSMGVSHLEPPPWLPIPGVRRVLIVDLHHLPMSAAVRESLSALARRHPLWVWNRRFVAVDTATMNPSLTAYAAVERPANAAWRWLVNPTRPPILWSHDREPATVAAIFEARPEVTSSAQVGGGGGTPFEWLCPEGQMLSALQGRLGRAPALVAALRPVCGASSLATFGPWLGQMPEESQFEVFCATHQHLTGLVGRAGAFIDAIGAVCEAADRGAQSRARTITYGGSGGHAFQLDCPAGRVAVGLAGRRGARIDALAVRCAPTTW